MRLIKKLIILSGKGRGSLILEKNAYGVTGKLSLNGIDGQNRRLIVISGGDSFITKIGGEKVKVEMGDIDYDEILIIRYRSFALRKQLPDETK